MTAKTIKVDTLARVEGEGALLIKIAGDRLMRREAQDLRAAAILRGLSPRPPLHELADIMARICGICPVAYQMSAIQAVEQAFGRHLDPRIKALRRLLYLRRMDREPRAAHLSSACAGLSGLTKTASRWRPSIPERVKARSRGEEGRQRADDRHRRPRDPPGLDVPRRLLQGAAQSRTSNGSPILCGRPATSGSRRCVG